MFHKEIAPHTNWGQFQIQPYPIYYTHLRFMYMSIDNIYILDMPDRICTSSFFFVC